ncbi:MAG: sigma 54-interacting transcriptional regulator [Deltaproteobacteria bacterium]|nr:sigma 54-interacting transcriptional regulator [Deltaproteobacteria bacterium]
MGPAGARSIPLPEAGRLTVGRHANSDVCLEDDPAVSRHHAVLHLSPALEVEDLGAANGTFVGGRRVPGGGRRALRPGEPVQVGATVLVVRQRATPAPPAEAVVASPALRRLYAEAEQVAAGRLAVLLLGETGVGKEVLARHIHLASPRARGPFITLNCGALAPSLLESELFGYDKGAFTGADQPKLGLIEAAHGGTVLLDEVGELPGPVQVKLLRVLEDQEVLRLGSVTPRKVDVRFLAATNRDLEAESRAGRFRPDLFYRLAGATLTVPPLRARADELPALVAHFAALAAAEAGVPRPELSAEALAALATHEWPGNLRELRNVVTRAVLLCRGGAVRPEHLPAFAPRRVEAASWVDDGGGTADLDPAQAAERARVVGALRAHNGNQTRAAQALGISRQTFVKKLDRYGIPRPRKPVE